MCDCAPREKAADGERDQKDNDSHLWINSPQRNLPRLPPNGSRLSCGRNGRRRKAAGRQKKRLAGEGTQFYPRGRPAASSAC